MAETEAAIPQIGSLVKDTALDGEKVRVDEILNKEIVVCGFKITASKYKDKGCGYCSKVQFCFVDDANKILSDKLHRKIKDAKFMALVDGIIFSFPGGKNCPIGNYCSQWFGNYYLSFLDNYIKHELKCVDYERFCDDFILFSNDKNYLNDCREKIRAFLKDELDLEYSKCDLFKTKQGVDFCGYRHFGKYVLLRKSTAKRIKRRFRKIVAAGVLSESDKGSIASMNGWLKHCCSWHLRQKLGLDYKIDLR